MTDAAAPERLLDTFPKLLEHNARVRGDRPAVGETRGGVRLTRSWAELRDDTRALALGFAALGLTPGERVAILAAAGPALDRAMVAAQWCGAIPVPLHPDAGAEATARLLAHAEAGFAVVEDRTALDRALAAAASSPTLRLTICLDPRDLRGRDRAALHAAPEVEALGRAMADELGPALDALAARGDGADICVILYDPAAAGRPKGAVLTNDNVIVTARTSVAFDGLTEEDVVLAQHPAGWVGDHVFSMGRAYVSGFRLHRPQGPETPLAELAAIAPTVLHAPPRLFEALGDAAAARLRDAGPARRRLNDRVMALALRVGPDLLDGRPVAARDRLAHRLGTLLVLHPLRKALGLHRLRVAYTAGGAIGPELLRLHRALGVNLKRLHGRTEASAALTVQPDGEARADTVGPPAPGVELRLTDTGEILYRSPGAFREYHREPEATAAAKDAEGWVATGDAGVIEEATGHLRILDRAEDIGRMADGALFAPQSVETRLKFHPAIREAVVFGAGRERCVAFIDVDAAAIRAGRPDLARASHREVAADPQVYATVQAAVEAVNRGLAADPMLSGAQIHRFLILHAALEAEDGDPARLGRAAVAARCAPLVDALHAGAPSVYAEMEAICADGRRGRVAATLEIREAAVVPATLPRAAE